MTIDEVDGGFAEDIGQVAVSVAVFDAAVAIQPIAIIGIPAALKTDELLETARPRMITPVQRAIVPLADQTGRVTGAAQDLRHRRFIKPQTVEAPRFQRVDAAGAMGVAARHQSRARWRAHGRRRVVLRQDDAFVHQGIQRRRARYLIVEYAKIAITHVIGDDEDDIRFGS